MRIPKCRPHLSLLVITAAYAGSKAEPLEHVSPGRSLERGNSPFLPDFLNGKPENDQAHTYSAKVHPAPHVAWGGGLHRATTGVPASFTIQLVGEGKNAGRGGQFRGLPRADWSPINGKRFIYVWIASEDQIMIAEVTGNDRGNTGSQPTTLTATFTSDFPGNYLVYIEEVHIEESGDQGRPIVGSPFSLTITTDDSGGRARTAPTLDVTSLPVCGSQEDARKDLADTFWRPGTWLSSNVASPVHGVLRNGWVFQPKTCVFDTFSYDDLMQLSSLEDEPTWLLVVGGSVQRGVFLTLVDMVLARGQKDQMAMSVVQKCWGYADIQIGNLRLTYQDLRLYQVSSTEDTVVCNNEKLMSGSTSAFVHSCEEFLNSTVFSEGANWPTAILAPSKLIDNDEDALGPDVKGPNFAIEVMINALPLSWDGTLLFVEHMDGFETRQTETNPTRTAFENVGIKGNPRWDSGKNDVLRKLEHYQSLHPSVTFLSAFPIYQGKLFENQKSTPGFRRYGSSVHYHYLSKSTSSPETHNGARIVQSTMTEMLSNILIGKAVGTKAALYARVAAAARNGINMQTDRAGQMFTQCWDCPQSLLPVHVKSIPEPVCKTLMSLEACDKAGEVWDGELCPEWCMSTVPTSRAGTESGPVDVRECNVNSAPSRGTRGARGPGATR